MSLDKMARSGDLAVFNKKVVKPLNIFLSQATSTIANMCGMYVPLMDLYQNSQKIEFHSELC